MGQLRLFGMKNAYDEILVSAVAVPHCLRPPCHDLLAL
jgi:hypothetical protein